MKYVVALNKKTGGCVGIFRDEVSAHKAIEKRKKFYPNEKDDEFKLLSGDAPSPAFTVRD